MPPKKPLAPRPPDDDSHDAVVCPLQRRDGLPCHKQCGGAQKWRSIQEHIRRAHPDCWAPGFRATADSLQEMMERAKSGKVGSHFADTPQAQRRQSGGTVKPMAPQLDNASLPRNSVSISRGNVGAGELASIQPAVRPTNANGLGEGTEFRNGAAGPSMTLGPDTQFLPKSLPPDNLGRPLQLSQSVFRPVDNLFAANSHCNPPLTPLGSIFGNTLAMSSTFAGFEDGLGDGVMSIQGLGDEGLVPPASCSDSLMSLSVDMPAPASSIGLPGYGFATVQSLLLGDPGDTRPRSNSAWDEGVPDSLSFFDRGGGSDLDLTSDTDMEMGLPATCSPMLQELEYPRILPFDEMEGAPPDQVLRSNEVHARRIIEERERAEQIGGSSFGTNDSTGPPSSLVRGETSLLFTNGSMSNSDKGRKRLLTGESAQHAKKPARDLSTHGGPSGTNPKLLGSGQLAACHDGPMGPDPGPRARRLEQETAASLALPSSTSEEFRSLACGARGDDKDVTNGHVVASHFTPKSKDSARDLEAVDHDSLALTASTCCARLNQGAKLVQIGLAHVRLDALGASVVPADVEWGYQTDGQSHGLTEGKTHTHASAQEGAHRGSSHLFGLGLSNSDGTALLTLDTVLTHDRGAPCKPLPCSLLTVDTSINQFRLACPYQVFDRSRTCFIRTARNPHGGCQGIKDLLQHLLAVHTEVEGEHGSGVPKPVEPARGDELKRFKLSGCAEDDWWEICRLLTPCTQGRALSVLKTQYWPYYVDEKSALSMIALTQMNLASFDVTGFRSRDIPAITPPSSTTMAAQTLTPPHSTHCEKTISVPLFHLSEPNPGYFETGNSQLCTPPLSGAPDLPSPHTRPSIIGPQLNGGGRLQMASRCKCAGLKTDVDKVTTLLRGVLTENPNLPRKVQGDLAQMFELLSLAKEKLPRD